MSVSKEMLELADRITSHLVTLATTSMKLPLAEWGIISNDVLSAAAALRASAVAEPVRCFGCGSSWTDDDLRRAKAENSLLRSCCPERKPLTIDQWQELAIARPAPAAPVPASVREALEHVLQATQGRVMNARIDLQCGQTKAQVARTLGGIVDFVDGALASLPAPEASPTGEEIAKKLMEFDNLQTWELTDRERATYLRHADAILALKAAPAKPHHVALGSDIDDGQRGKERE